MSAWSVFTVVVDALCLCSVFTVVARCPVSDGVRSLCETRLDYSLIIPFVCLECVHCLLASCVCEVCSLFAGVLCLCSVFTVVGDTLCLCGVCSLLLVMPCVCVECVHCCL